MIKVITNIDEGDWSKLVKESSFATFFQTKECYDFYNSLSFMKSFLFGVIEENELKGIICGYIISNGSVIKRYFSRRAIVHGGPLLANHISDEAVSSLLNQTKEYLKRKSIYIEFRNNNDYSQYRNIFEKNGFEYQPHLNYMVETHDGIEKVFSKLSESKRRQIKKAKEFGVDIIKTTEMHDVDEFYSILSKLYKQKVKKPLFPKEFFEKLITLPHAHLFVAKYNNRVISGMACVSIDKTTVYEWLVGGDNELYNHIYPSVAITYAAIEYAANNGFDKFDFMGAGKPDENYGVRDFKEKFGGKLVENGRFLYICNKILHNIGKFYILKVKT